MKLISNLFIVYSNESSLYKNAGRGLVALHTDFAFFLGYTGERYCYSYKFGVYKFVCIYEQAHFPAIDEGTAQYLNFTRLRTTSHGRL